MAALTRVLQKIFGETGDTAEFGQVGSDSAGSPTTTKNLDTIQSLSQYAAGLFAITANLINPPRGEDFNALLYLITAQLKYLFQSGVPEWIATENYYANKSFVIGSNGNIYKALTGTDVSPNINHNPVGDTTNWAIVWDKTNDGTGSGLDADLLDGQSGSYYQNAGNLNAGTIPSGRLSAYDLLTLIKTVDGSGSGLDADLIRGLPPVYTAASALPVLQYSVSDFNTIPFFGVLFVTTSSPANAPFAGFHVGLQMAVNNDTNYRLQFVMANQDGALYTRRQSAGTWGAWHTIWNSANDGSGSGLDADTVDGSHYNATDILTKLKTVDGPGSGLDADLLDGVQGSGYVNTTGIQTIGGIKTFSSTIQGNITSADKAELRSYGEGNTLQIGYYLKVTTSTGAVVWELVTGTPTVPSGYIYYKIR